MSRDYLFLEAQVSDFNFFGDRSFAHVGCDVAGRRLAQLDRELKLRDAANLLAARCVSDPRAI
jgi:hypothetical protein